MDKQPCEVPQNKARKKQARPEKWKANVAKKERYSAKALPLAPNCNHSNKRFMCLSVNGQLLRQFHTAFYKNTSKTYQDAILLKCCTACPTKRKRPRTGQRTTKQFTVAYHIIANKRKVPVCQKVFLRALRLKKGRVLNVVAKSFETGQFPTDKRGGDHRSHKYAEFRQSIHTFIKTLKCKETHYCRSQTSVREYLPSELNIRKLFKMYKSITACPHPKESYFRRIFNNKYNLGFGSPRTDICSFCLQMQENIKTEKNLENKNYFIIEKRVHTLRVKAFYSLLKEKVDGVKTISFDCQKNMALPKLPDQSCYYSRQLNLYNFTIVEGSSKDKLTKENVFAYLWTEDTSAKDSNTIASALYHQLEHTDLRNKRILRLIADGCGGQNKNSTVIAMCGAWLLNHPEIKQIELVFPITGHSYLPADRVFGNSEKSFRKVDTITNPVQYENIIAEQSTVLKLGDDCAVYDWKKASVKIIKPPGQWKIKFSQCRRFYYKSNKQRDNVLVLGERFYKSITGNYGNICKKDKNMRMIIPEVINKGLPVNSLKLRDIKMLLVKHYGNLWEEMPQLAFYKKILEANQVCNTQEEESTSNMEPDCEPQEETQQLFI